MVAVDHHLRCASALDAVACDNADEAFVGVGVDKNAHVHELTEFGVVEYEDTFDYHYVAWVHSHSLGLACAGEVAVSGHFDGVAFFQRFEMSGEKRPFDCRRLVEVDFLSLLGRDVARIFVVRVLRNYGYFSLWERVDYFVDDGGFA